MTIGIGMACRDGIVLCADTEITLENWYKYRSSKIIVSSDADNRLIFVQAGDIDAGKLLIEKLTETVQEKDPATFRELKEILRAQCREFYKKEKLYPQLVVAWRTKKQAFLLALESSSLIEVTDMCCVGTGSGVIQRVLESYYRPGMSVRGATFAAAYAAKEAKDYGLGVGGPTQIVQIFNTGKWDIVQPSEVERLEQDYTKAQELLGCLLTAYTPLFMPESKAFREDMKRLTRHLRKSYKNRGHLAGSKEQQEIENRLRQRQRRS